MEFKTYWNGLSPELQAAFAERCQTTVKRLKALAGRRNRATAPRLVPHLAMAIEDASGRMVDKAEFRPDLWDRRPDAASQPVAWSRLSLADRATLHRRVARRLGQGGTL